MTRLSWFGCWLLLVSPSGILRAELVCTEPLHDAGAVSSGSLLSHPFRFVNRGSNPIEITAVKPGCSCLRPHVEQTTIAPGQQSALTLEINTLTQAPGPNLWGAVVHYLEDGKAETLNLYLRAQVKAVVRIEPASLLIQTQTAARGTFTLTERRDRPLAIQSLTTASPHVRITCSEPVREADAWKRTITLEVLASMPEGRRDDVLKVLTTDSPYGEWTVPFIVVKRSPDRVQALPASLNFIVTNQASVPSRIVMLEVSDDKPVRVERIDTSHPFIHCTWASGPGARTTLRIAFDSDRLPGEKGFEGQVRVHVVKPLAQEVVIPIHCVKP